MEHYYTRNPLSPLKFYLIKKKVRGFDLTFHTSTGVFSPKKIDTATKLLAENMIIKKNEAFLDLGSGYGVIGIVAFKMGANVSMSEINLRALMLMKKNIKENKVKAEIIDSNGFESINNLFDNICLNPPISAGMKLCQELIKESFNHLKKNGILQIVARHNKGGSRLEKFMQEEFKNSKVLAKKGGFKVYASTKI
ncbi:MAG: methyltransferase [Candidatus Nanoarchaeia archaeon]|nr:methyltransferase [Candidatus Nanoarchaeia archaeon]MDD5053784.1 methyltransferase [Candidatus Nanoarchaeia archaeon]MDD5499376.1 methyltransferase [Candidatus Nanoarchaeia archaeon]